MFRRAGPEEGEVSPPHRPSRGQDRQAGGSRHTRFTFVEITSYEILRLHQFVNYYVIPGYRTSMISILGIFHNIAHGTVPGIHSIPVLRIRDPVPF